MNFGARVRAQKSALKQSKDVMVLQRVATAWRIAIIATALVGLSSASHGQTKSSKARSASSQVYILRGFMNMSPGLDALAEQIERRGVPATVGGHAAWSSLAQDAIQKYKNGRLRSIVIVGHSMGGGAALDMATELGQAGIPVNLVVTLDLVGTAVAPRNVRYLINYHVAGGVGAVVQRSANARGVVRNVNETKPEVGHFTIVALRERDILGQVLRAARSGVSAPAPATSNGAGPASASVRN
jgi:pimeloyl-ACP methyl ester carboxylesterase